jgi:hypothetical protein
MKYPSSNLPSPVHFLIIHPTFIFTRGSLVKILCKAITIHYFRTSMQFISFVRNYIYKMEICIYKYFIKTRSLFGSRNMIPATDHGNLVSATSNPFMLFQSLSALLIRVTEHILSFPFATLFESRTQEFHFSNALFSASDITSHCINTLSVTLSLYID